MKASIIRSAMVGVCVAALLGLGGCTPGTVRPGAGPFADLQGDTPQLTYGTKLPITSTQEGIDRAEAAYAHGDADLAVYEYVRTLALDPKNAEILYRIGAIHAKEGHRRRAEKAFRMALERNKKHAGAQEGLGLLLLEKRKYAAAKKHLKAALAVDPGRWRAQSGLGVLDDLRQNFDAARKHYKAALEIHPNSPRLLNNLGYSRYLAGDWDGAEKYFRRALRQDPGHKQTWRNLALLYTRRGDYSRAVDAFSQVMEPAAAYNDVGYLLMNEGKYDKAEHYFRKAASVSPTYDVVANRNLSRLKLLRGSR